MLSDGKKLRNLGWCHWLPNPLFPFVAFRVGLPAHHPLIRVERWTQAPLDDA